MEKENPDQKIIDDNEEETSSLHDDDEPNEEADDSLYELNDQGPNSLHEPLTMTKDQYYAALFSFRQYFDGINAQPSAEILKPEDAQAADQNKAVDDKEKKTEAKNETPASKSSE